MGFLLADLTFGPAGKFRELARERAEGAVWRVPRPADACGRLISVRLPASFSSMKEVSR
jgi:hypothetical protein